MSELLDRVDRYNVNLPPPEPIAITSDEAYELAFALTNGELKSVKGRYMHVDQVLKSILDGSFSLNGHPVKVL